ncbi:MAG: ribonuclease III [Lachnospiraceae bacterium]|nr:ribonuclease III [Lachnospiraceae bacterium]
MLYHKLETLQKKIGYHFHDFSLLIQAMSHSSYANEHRSEGLKDNERLEFLGDAVLEVTSSEFLFREYPNMPEGDLTKLRASIVCEPTLALCAREFGLPEYLLLGKGEEHTGGRGRNSIVSDALEALIGAIYLDGGFASAKEFIIQFIMTDIEHKKLFYDSKTILQEIVQRDFKDEEVVYELMKEEGPDHAKKFVVEVKLGPVTAGTGVGSTKKAAEQEAAYRAIIELKGKNACI